MGYVGPIHSSSPCLWGDAFQDPPWRPETTGSTKLYIYYIFSYIYIPVIKFIYKLDTVRD